MFKNKFIDWKIVISIISIFGFLYFSKYSPFYFPYFLSEIENETCVEILVNINRGITSILGLTISILIISIQIYRNKFDDYAVKIILENKKLRRVVTSFIIILILSFYSLIFIPKNASDTVFLNRMLFLLALFLLNICNLFFSISNIIYSTSNIEILENLNKKITLESFKSLINLEKKESTLEKLKERDFNPINEVQKLTNLSIKNNDEHFFEQLCEIRKISIFNISKKSISEENTLLHSWNIVELYIYYYGMPTYENLKNNKNDRLFVIFIDELCEILRYFHRNKITSGISKLTEFIYVEILNFLNKEEKNTLVIGLFSNSVYDLYLIFNEFNEPIKKEILLLTNYSYDGKSLDVKNSKSDFEIAEAMENEGFIFEVQKFLNYLESFIDLAIKNKNKELFDSLIGKKLISGNYQNILFDIIVGNPLKNCFHKIKLVEKKFYLSDELKSYYIDKILKKLFESYLIGLKNDLIQQEEIEYIVEGIIYHNILKNENMNGSFTYKKLP